MVALSKKAIEAGLAEAAMAGSLRSLKQENERLRNEVRTIDLARRFAERELLEHTKRTSFLDGAPAISPVLMNPNKRRKVNGSATAIIALGDWHVEERVDPSTVNGFNCHNPKEASKKIKTTFAKALELLDAERSMSNIGELVVALLGDFITGFIHPELAESNYLSPSKAILFADDHIAGGLELLLKHSGCKSIIVPAMCGNHGRTTEKQRIATSYENSFEWLMYKYLEKHFRHEPRIQWKVENGYHNYLNVQGKVIRFHHGHAFRYQGGVQGPAVPIRRKIAAWDTQKTAWMDIFGHLHQHIVDPKFILNGPLIGYGAYGEFAVGGKCPATQTLIVVDRKVDMPTCIKPILCCEQLAA